MKNRGRYLLVFIVGVCFAGRLQAIDINIADDDGGQSGSFLDFSASARSLAMGKAHTGAADDASAIYWNPAGLTQLDRGDAVTLYSNLYEGFNYGTLNVAQPTRKWGTIGVGVVSLRADGFRRFNSVGVEDGTYTESRTAVLLSHARRINSAFSFGATLKGVRQSVANYSGSGFGADLGGLFRMSDRLQFGATLRNAIQPKLSLASNGEHFPTDLRVGVNFVPRQSLTLTGDLSKSESRNVKMFLGAEYRLNQMLSLRAGFNETELATGLGFILGDFALDYALGYHQAVPVGDDLGMSHRFGVRMRFGKVSPEAQKELAQMDWKKRAKLALKEAESAVQNEGRVRTDEEKKRVVHELRSILIHQGFNSEQEEFTAQSYISFLQGNNERSLKLFNKAQKK